MDIGWLLLAGYVDPSNGGMLLQLLAGSVAIYFIAARGWIQGVMRRAFRRIARRVNKQPADSPD